MEFDHNKKKTYTKYWNNFSSKPRKYFYFSVFLKKIKKYLYEFLGYTISIRVYKKKSQVDEAYVSYPLENNIKKHRNNLIIKEFYLFLKQSGLTYNKSEIQLFLNEFDNIFSKSPIKEHESGFGYNEALFFFVLLKIIKPELVIESGVMKGFTTYLIDSATNDDCIIYSYDINFENKVYSSKKATYINTDINNKIPLFKNKKTLALWDDHTSQMDRLKFSQDHNIKYNFFDDDLSFLNIHADGWPPIPTVSMLKDIINNDYGSETISWISRNRKGTAYLNNITELRCIHNVKFHKFFPQLFPITGYKNHSQCSLVINKTER